MGEDRGVDAAGFFEGVAQDRQEVEVAIADVVADVKHYLQARVVACEAAGIGRDRIVIDPGFGFGKTVAHNLALVRQLPDFVSLRLPVLMGMSRKSTIRRDRSATR